MLSLIVGIVAVMFSAVVVMIGVFEIFTNTDKDWKEMDCYFLGKNGFLSKQEFKKLWNRYYKFNVIVRSIMVFIEAIINVIIVISIAFFTFRWVVWLFIRKDILLEDCIK